MHQLMAKAFNTSLTLQQQQEVLAEFENDPNFVYRIGLTPSKVCIKFHSYRGLSELPEKIQNIMYLRKAFRKYFDFFFNYFTLLEVTRVG